MTDFNYLCGYVTKYYLMYLLSYVFKQQPACRISILLSSKIHSPKRHVKMEETHVVAVLYPFQLHILRSVQSCKRALLLSSEQRWRKTSVLRNQRTCRGVIFDLSALAKFGQHNKSAVSQLHVCIIAANYQCRYICIIYATRQESTLKNKFNCLCFQHRFSAVKEKSSNQSNTSVLSHAHEHVNRT